MDSWVLGLFSWYLEYEKYCEECAVLDLIPLTFDEWLNKE